MDLDKDVIKGKKLRLFKMLAILVPVLLLLVLEMVLRIFNYGHNTNLFMKDPHDERFMVMNYYASDKYFSDTVNATKGNQELFTINKAPNTFRIFVLGESTTIGYPYRYNGSFHRWLQYRLMQQYPDKNFEIINLSLTAVNSYTVLDFGRQLPRYQPDAVLIYTGHNEYYGALGIGSTSYIGSNHLLIETLLYLRSLKLVQLLNNGIKKITTLFSGTKVDTRETLMKRMAVRQHIVYQSADYQAGISQFNRNMTELCGIFNDKKIPVFLSTVVSNEKDLPPFISARDSLHSASYYYSAGKLAQSQSNFDKAKKDFVKAKELDELRFRAPDEINMVIKKLALEYPVVHLVDTKAMFEQYSPNGIIGNETILEHVHPNLFGYAIMSEAFYRAFQQQHLIKDTAERMMTFDELQKEMPVTRMDSLNGQNQINLLETGWPFNKTALLNAKPGNNLEDILAEKVALNRLQWIDAMHELFENDKQTKNVQHALKVMEGSWLEYPQSELFCDYAAKLSAILNNYDKAAFYYRKLYMLNANEQTGLKICQMYLKADQPERLLANIQYVPQAQQENIRMMLVQIINDKLLIKEQPGNALAKQRIATNYKQLGADDTALKYTR